jgi:hypothetical protein
MEETQINATTESAEVEANDTDSKIETAAEQTTESTDWKKEARKWEARAKADKELADKYREYESSQKTDFEKLQEELNDYKSKAEANELAKLKLEVATDKELPREALDLLTGSNREELEAKAEALLSLIGKSVKPNIQPNPEQGKPAVTTNQITSRDQLKGMTNAEIMEAKATGRLDALLKNQN